MISTSKKEYSVNESIEVILQNNRGADVCLNALSVRGLLVIETFVDNAWHPSSALEMVHLHCLKDSGFNTIFPYDPSTWKSTCLNVPKKSSLRITRVTNEVNCGLGSRLYRFSQELDGNTVYSNEFRVKQ